VAFSVVTLIELAHGAARADTAERKTMRRQFLQELTTALPVHPVTVPVPLRAGQIDGESTAKGVRIALSDLLIGVTALELGYRVGYRKWCVNSRWFQGSKSSPSERALAAC
jgi:predicted nucleic acid-binding protein